MKIFTPLWFVISLSIALLGAAAQESMMTEKPVAAAAATPPATTPAKPVSRTQEILQRFDKNGDGKLDDDEKADAHETMQMEQMTKGVPAGGSALTSYQALALELFDRNHDGRLDEDERAEALAFVRQPADGSYLEVMVKRFDKNADGKLDEAERREAQAYTEENRGEIMQEVLLKRYDKNHNAQLDPEEKAAIKEAFDKNAGAEPERQAPPSAASLLEKFDADKDRKLDETELAAALKFLRTAGPPRLVDPETAQARLDRVKAEIARRRAARGEGQPVEPAAAATAPMPPSPDEKK